jgi:hypothetical protein
VWVRRERERQLQKEEGGSRDLPFGLYLLFSSFTAIAAVGAGCLGGGRGHGPAAAVGHSLPAQSIGQAAGSLSVDRNSPTHLSPTHPPFPPSP